MKQSALDIETEKNNRNPHKKLTIIQISHRIQTLKFSLNLKKKWNIGYPN